MTESVELALAAGALAVLVIWILLRTAGASIPDLQLILEWRALLFTGGIAGVIAGILLVWRRHCMRHGSPCPMSSRTRQGA